MSRPFHPWAEAAGWAAALILALGWILVSLASAQPYLEARYTLLGNYPSVIGNPTCPCIGSELIAGWEAHPFGLERWRLDASAGANFQTRWDDPESYKFGIRSEIDLGKYATWLLAYEQRHNFDRPSVIPDEYLDFSGRHTREEGNFLWGISGLRYLYTGVRWTFR